MTVAGMIGEEIRETYRTDLLTFARSLESQTCELAGQSAEAAILRVLLDCSRRGEQPTCKRISADVLEEEGDNDPKLKLWLSPKKVGWIVREIGLKTQHTRDGSVVILDESRLRQLASVYGVDT